MRNVSWHEVRDWRIGALPGAGFASWPAIIVTVSPEAADRLRKQTKANFDVFFQTRLKRSHELWVSLAWPD